MAAATTLKTRARQRMSAEQWARLAGIKQKALRAVAVTPFVALLRALPRWQSVRIKEGLRLTGTLDYEKQDVVMRLDAAPQIMRLRACRKEPETIEWIESTIRSGEVFYDVGANVGAYSLVAWKARGCRVYAFEPSFSTFAGLCHNVILNNCAGEIVPLQIALSDETGLVTFNYSDLAPGAAIHSVGQPIDQDGHRFDPEFAQPTLSVRLDDLVARFGLPTPHHIKIDTDGAEFRVLSGAPETLLSPTLRTIFVEVNEGLPQHSNVLGLLETSGFKVRSRHSLRMSPAYFNYVFERRDS